MFTTQGRAVIGRSYFNSFVWKAALKAAGLETTRENGYHSLRHHFASLLLASGVDIRALASYLGHHDPGFTLRTYVHLMPDASDRMCSAVDRVLDSGASDGPATARQAVQYAN